MVITYKENEIPKITFSDLCIGEVFEFKMGEITKLYMKVETSDIRNNAWDFYSETLDSFDTFEEVVPVDAELIVSERNY